MGPDPVQEALARGHERGRAAAMDEANRTLKRAAGLLVSTAEALDAARLGVVRELEDNLGLKLFDRHTRMLRLTHAGAEVLPLARRALTDLDGKRWAGSRPAVGGGRVDRAGGLHARDAAPGGGRPGGPGPQGNLSQDAR